MNCNILNNLNEKREEILKENMKSMFKWMQGVN